MTEGNTTNLDGTAKRGSVASVYVPSRLKRDGESSLEAAVRMLKSGWRPGGEAAERRFYEYLTTDGEALEARIAAGVEVAPTPAPCELAPSCQEVFAHLPEPRRFCSEWRHTHTEAWGPKSRKEERS